MGKYSEQAASCNAELDAAIRTLNDVKSSQGNDKNRLSKNRDVISKCTSPTLDNIEGQIDSAISAIESLKGSISAAAKELDEEEERKAEAARKAKEAAEKSDSE